MSATTIEAMAPTPIDHRAPQCSAIHPTTGAPTGLEPKNTMRYRLMTRPLTVGSVLSWIVVLAAVIMVRVKNPTRTDVAEKAQNVGMIAMSPEVMPKPKAAPTTKRTRGLDRRAAARAPARDPIAMTEPSSPYSPAPRSNTSRAITAEVSWKFIPSADTTNTVIIMTTMSLRWRT